MTESKQEATSRISELRTRFAEHFGDSPEFVAYAPGRIEILGNHVDYNGGSVLGAAIDRGIHVAVSKRSEPKCHLISDAFDGEIEVKLGTDERQTDNRSWANYPLGVAHQLIQAGHSIESGFNWAATSTLPLGMGLSSSAALELSTAYALASLYEIPIEPGEMARICRAAENDFVGMPCGILDQGVSAFGGNDQLVHIDCFKEDYRQVEMPAGCQFWIIDSGCKHSLVDSHYADRRNECMAAFDCLKTFVPDAACLAAIDPKSVREHQSSLDEIPFKRALHVTEENARVNSALAALADGDLDLLGKLLTASHQSSRDLFENSIPELDFLVDTAISLPGVFGARLTGGGFGGAIVAMTNERFESENGPSIIVQKYQEAFGKEAKVLACRAGDGARVCQ